MDKKNRSKRKTNRKIHSPLSKFYQQSPDCIWNRWRKDADGDTNEKTNATIPR